MKMRAAMLSALIGGTILLSGCTGPAEPKWATDADVARAAYHDDGPSTLTLFTVISNRSGAGAHSSLMVNGSQRVIFDPAGTWYHPHLPERNDVHFGMSDPIVDFYVDYHSRESHHTIIQEIEVSPVVAQIAMREILSYGAVPKAQCSKSVTAILARIPGFESVGHTWYPKQLSQSFALLPGVTVEKVYDNDPSDNTGVIMAPPVIFAAAN